jgi:hypothetical protein
MTDKSEQIRDHLWVDLREVLDACPVPIIDILETDNLITTDTNRPGVVVFETTSPSGEKDVYEIAVDVKRLNNPIEG